MLILLMVLGIIKAKQQEGTFFDANTSKELWSATSEREWQDISTMLRIHPTSGTGTTRHQADHPAASENPTALNSLHHCPHPLRTSTRYLQGNSEADSPGSSKNSPGRCRHKIHQKIDLSTLLFCLYLTWTNRR